MRGFALLVPALFLAGCHPHGIGALTGNWKSSRGTDFTFDGTKKFHSVSHRNGKDFTETGTLEEEGDTIKLAIDTVNGTPIATLKSALEKRGASVSPLLRANLSRLGLAETYRLSADGRTLTKEGGTQPYTITKS